MAYLKLSHESSLWVGCSSIPIRQCAAEVFGALTTPHLAQRMGAYIAHYFSFKKVVRAWNDIAVHGDEHDLGPIQSVANEGANAVFRYRLDSGVGAAQN